MEKAGMKGTVAYRLVSKTFFLLWIVFRLAIFPYIFYKMYMAWDDILDCHPKYGPYTAGVLTLNAIFLFLLNYVHFWQTIRFLWNPTAEKKQK